MPADPDFDLSVIVPCFNGADILGEQLDALSRQQWAGRWEVVIVNNRSTDNTRDVALASSLGDRLRIVDATDSQGVAYARNTGVAASQAHAVAFCDQDDVVHAGWIAAMGDALRDEPLVAGAVNVDRINEAWLAGTRPAGGSDKLPHFGPHPFARGNNCGMQRKLWEHLDGYDEAFVGLEDVEFSLRAAAIGVRPSFVADAIVDYRFRIGIGDLWKQGYHYGRGRRELSRRARALGLQPPSPANGLKSWAWLVVHLPDLRSRTGRHASTWVLANRIGSLAGLVARPQPFDSDGAASDPWPDDSQQGDVSS